MQFTEQTRNVVNWQLTQDASLMQKILKSVERHIHNEAKRAFIAISHMEGYAGVTLEDVEQDLRLLVMQLCDRFNHHKGANFFTYLTTCKLAGSFVSRIARQHHYCNVSVDIASRLPANHPATRNTVYLSRVLEGPAHEGFQLVETNELRQLVRANLSKIKSPRLKRILRLRFGMTKSGTCHTLQEISEMKEFQVTRERIRQLEAKAIAQLKSNPELQELLND